ncbi:MAG: hypothetical protein ACI4IH_02055 [Eubacterium sp.]
MSYKPIGVSMNTKLLNAIDSAMPKVDAISRSQFICKAVEYYLAALNVKDISNILSPAVESSIRASVRLSEMNISSILFKLAVETDMMMHITAATNEIDKGTLKDLREMCVEEVKSTIGRINFDSAVRTQKG